MRMPEPNEDLTGKVCVCSVGRAAVVVGKGVLDLPADKGGQIEVWQGIGFDGRGTWASKSPCVIAESMREFHDKLLSRFGGRLGYNG